MVRLRHVLVACGFALALRHFAPSALATQDPPVITTTTAPDVEEATSPPPVAMDAAINVSAAESLDARLAALTPDDPLAYFLLAEDAADMSQADLARQLFVLAAHLDPARFERSACLALADLADRQGDGESQRTLLGMASMAFGGHAADVVPADAGASPAVAASSGVGEVSPLTDRERAFRHAASRVSATLGYYRLGQGQRALAAFDVGPESEAIVRNYGRAFGSLGRVLAFCRSYPRCPNCKSERVVKCSACRGTGVAEGRRDCPTCGGDKFVVCSTCRGRPGEAVSDEQLDAMLRFEVGLLARRGSTWPLQLDLDEGRPRPALESHRLPAMFNIDPTRTLYRDGQWLAP